MQDEQVSFEDRLASMPNKVKPKKAKEHAEIYKRKGA